MKTFKIIVGLIFLFSAGCGEQSTGPEPNPVASSVSVSGDVTESYAVTAFYGIMTYTADTLTMEYFSILLIPNVPGSNALAMTLLYKSGADNPQSRSFEIGEYAFGDQIPADSFAASFSSINSEQMDGYTMTDGQLIIKSVSAAEIAGEFIMTGFWRSGFEEDRERTVNVSGSFTAMPIPD
jgi:hypothetical protein